MKTLLEYLRSGLLSIVVGGLSGLAASVLLISLNWVTEIRTLHPHLLYFLPLAGLFIGWSYHRYGSSHQSGSNLVIDQIHDPKNTLPFLMVPFIFFGTLITHLFGGSAGREGTAVQMGAALADQIHRFFPLSKEQQKTLLVAGSSAGFGAVIGAPWAGMIFGMEMLTVGRIKFSAVIECFISSFTGYALVNALGIKHTFFPRVEIPAFQFSLLAAVIGCGVLFGITARIFSGLSHAIQSLQAKFVRHPSVRPFIGGIILVVFFIWEGSFRYEGLGLPLIQEALSTPAHFRDPILKNIFTAITVGSGFKGGEFIPLVFIGTTLGSALAPILMLPCAFLGALGFAAVFGAAANTPVACSLMAMELFGYKIGFFAFLACFTAYYCSGPSGIYHAQRKANQR